MSNDYTNPNTNPNTLTTLALTLTNHHDAFESFCAPVFCDFVRNYSCTVDGAVVPSLVLHGLPNRNSLLVLQIALVIMKVALGYFADIVLIKKQQQNAVAY